MALCFIFKTSQVSDLKQREKIFSQDCAPTAVVHLKPETSREALTLFEGAHQLDQRTVQHLDREVGTCRRNEKENTGGGIVCAYPTQQ